MNFIFAFSIMKWGKYIQKFLFLLVALQILNVGLFAQDFEVIPQQNEDTNIINSVTEYIAEVICKKQDSFPEDNKAPQQHRHHFNLKNQIVKLIRRDYITIKSFNYIITTPQFHFEQHVYNAFEKEINPPPPKV